MNEVGKVIEYRIEGPSGELRCGEALNGETISFTPWRPMKPGDEFKVTYWETLYLPENRPGDSVRIPKCKGKP